MAGTSFTDPLAGAIARGQQLSQSIGGIDPATQTLLNAALDQGGAVAQTASEIVHPNGSFLTWAKDKLGLALTTTMDTLAIPAEGVAALVSQATIDPMSWSEAMKQHTRVSDVVFGTPNQDAGTAEKVGMFAARFMTDLFTDPLTYVTFGESSGMLGLSKLTEIPLSEMTASRLGVATADMLDASGKVIKEGLRHRSVSEEGLLQLQKITKNIEDRLVADTKDVYIGDTNIFGRLNRFAKQLADSTPEEATKLVGGKLGAERTIAEKLAIAAKDGPVDQATRMQIVKDAMTEQAESVARHTISARRDYIEEEAKRMMSRIIESNVARGGIILDKLGNPLVDQFGNKMVKDLASDWIDRGGMKVFGNTVISGLRMRAAAKLIPGISAVDTFTAPGRNMLATAFSTKYTQNGRVPDTLLKMQQSAKNARDVKQAEALSFIPKLYQKLGVTEGEDKIIAAAMTSDIPPTSGVDGRLETLWTLLHTEKGRTAAKDIIDGKYGEDVGKLWVAAQSIRKQMKNNLVMMHEAGIAAFPHKNYLPGILNEQKSILSPFAKFKTSKAVNAEKAELVKWRNMETKDEIFGTFDGKMLRTTDGKTIPFEKFSKAEERQRLEKEIAETVMQQKTKRDQIQSEVETLWKTLNEKMVKSIFAGSKDVLKGATEDVHNQQALEKAIRESIPEIDRNRILADYAKKYYEDGGKLAAETIEMTPDDIEALKNDLASGDRELDDIAKTILANLDKFGVKVTKASDALGKTSTNDYQKKLQELVGVIQDSGVAAKQRYLKEALDTDKFKEVISALSEEWHKNPGAISRIMESILGKNFDLASLMEDLSDTKRALEAELTEPGLKRVDDKWFYRDSEANIYQRVRATAKEINDNYFKGEEMFSESALKSAVQGSVNAIRSATSRELLNDIAKSFGIPASSAPGDFVQLGIAGLQKGTIDQSRYMALEGGKFALKNAQGEELRFHPVVAESVNNMLKVMAEDPASNAMLQGYDKLTQIWKASVTSVFPSFHGRNAISNVFQNMMDIGYEALNPANHVLASQILVYNHQLEKLAFKAAEGDTAAAREMLKIQNKVVLTDAAGHDWTAGEITRVARDNVIAFHPDIVGNMDTWQSTRTQVDAMMDTLFPKTNKYGTALKEWANPGSHSFKPFEYGRNVGNVIESQARLVNFLANLKKLGDVQQAAIQTKQFLFDYQNLTPFEKNFMRRVFPFYTYARKNMELQVHTLLTKPGRIDMMGNAYSNIGDVWGGTPLSDEERNALPDWVKDGINVVVSRNGKNVSVLTSLGSPFEQPFQTMGNIMGATNPIIKGPIEQITGYSFFNGKPLSEVTNATAYSSPLVPQVIRDFIGYTENHYVDSSGKEHTQYVSLKPSHMNIFNNIPLTPRVLSTLKLMQTSDMSTQEKLLQGLLAMKPEEFNLDKETLKRNQEMQSQLQDVLDKAGIGYEFTRFQLKKK